MGICDSDRDAEREYSEFAVRMHPGRELGRRLMGLGADVEALARRCGVPFPALRRVLRLQAPVTPDIAEAFGEEVTGVPASVWLDLQEVYDGYIAHWPAGPVPDGWLAQAEGEKK